MKCPLGAEGYVIRVAWFSGAPASDVDGKNGID